MECFGCTSLIIVGLFVVYKLLDRLVRRPSVGHYDERYILVTGCDTGFGHGIAKRLDSIGCHVFAGCLTEKGETELKKTSSQRLHTISLDVTSEKSVQSALEYVKQQLPPGKGLWGVLNNAGVLGKCARVEWMSLADFRECAAVNLYGMVDVTMTFLPLVKKEHGRIVNTSSYGGRASLDLIIPYCVSKYGVEAFTDGLRRSLRPYNCKAILIEPGGHKTEMGSTIITRFQAAWNQAKPEVKEEFGEEFYEQFLESMKSLLDQPDQAGSPDIYPVVDAYQHALLGRYPRTRYLVGKDALVVVMIQALPEWLGDWIFEKLNPIKTPTPALLKRGL